MQNADEIINCGDCRARGRIDSALGDAESRCTLSGETSVDFFIDRRSYPGRVAKLKDQTDFQSLYEAGLSRAMGDWLLGMNATRLYTIKYGQNKQVLSIGRVQTPTLALIVNRQLEIANFEPSNNWNWKPTIDTTFSALIRKSDEEIAAEEEKNGGKKKIDNPGYRPYR